MYDSVHGTTFCSVNQRRSNVCILEDSRSVSKQPMTLKKSMESHGGCGPWPIDRPIGLIKSSQVYYSHTRIK